MSSLVTLSEAARSCLSLWALLLCQVAVFSAVLSAVQRQRRAAALSLLPFACGYALWQILFDLHLFGATRDAAPVSRRLGGLPWVVWLAALAVLTLSALLMLLSTIRRGRRSVTPTAIKHCLDRMPCGVCCWRDDGRVLFSNICMNRLCLAVTGGALLNGNRLFEAAAGGILTVGAERWRFVCRDIVLDGERLHEMTASNITAEYAKTQALERDRAELDRVNRALRAYTLGIDETVRRQELLQAKVNIHDEMNRLMLATMAAEGGDDAALDRIFTLWEQNALLLCMEADKTADARAAEQLERLADALKLRLVWRNALPAALSEAQRSLFFSAAQEAVANAVKHARADTMEIFFQEDADAVRCVFANDGRLPSGAVRFTGGLANLAALAQKQGACVSASGGDAFALCVRFPKAGKNQPDGGCAARGAGV